MNTTHTHTPALCYHSSAAEPCNRYNPTHSDISNSLIALLQSFSIYLEMKVFAAFLLLVGIVMGAVPTDADKADAKAARAKLGEFWDAAMQGDAEKYHSFFASNVKIVTNGEEDEAPWGDVKFVKSLFSKVRYGNIIATTPIAKSADGSYFITYAWTVTILATGQEIEMGSWSQKITFDGAGKISHISTVCDQLLLDRFSLALEPMQDLKAVLQTYVDAWNSGDVEKIIASTHPHFTFIR